MKILFFVSFLFLGACQTGGVKMSGYDQSQDARYLWLEDVNGVQALEFARKENQMTLLHLRRNPLFARLEGEIREIVLNKDKLLNVSIRGGKIYNFWQDDQNPKGVWRRTSVQSYKKSKPEWEILIDIDKLAKKENENWVWRGSSDLLPNRERSILYLSRGGKDAAVIREYDWKLGQFVTDGFQLPESKGSIEWIDQDHVLVGTDFGPGTMTTSGYPRQVRSWKRGDDFKKARLLYECAESDMSAYGSVSTDGEKKHLFIRRNINFYSSETFYLNSNYNLVKIPVPETVHFEGLYKGFVILNVQNDFGRYLAGSILSLPLKSIVEKGQKALEDIEIVFSPMQKVFVDEVALSETNFILTVSDNILRKSVKISRNLNKDWHQEVVTPMQQGSFYIQSIDESGRDSILLKTDFLTPSTQMLLSPSSLLEKLRSAPANFDSSDLQYLRYEVKSPDGTMIPYWVVSKKGLELNGRNPTVLYGYGGFLVSMSTAYRGLMGKAWLEKGGVYVLSHLRGGGEFGPKWHEAVLKENRPKVFDDFIAVAEDLMAKKITSPRHLGIWGGSNGGLLVGATMVKRPDLFNAVICEVPLLDMLRYHTLFAGASWMAEYGDPEDPKMRDVILSYSPFQNLNEKTKYPEMFVMTSTQDDRVHPGHARKLVAKMKDQGHPVLYYENTEGGHGRTSNPESEILWHSMQWTYFWEKLGHP